MKHAILTPEECGDNYADQLTDEDKQKILTISCIWTLPDHLVPLCLPGRQDFGVKLSDHKASLRFEVPRIINESY